jgi:peptide subunit release factor 1 (eRF1)
MEMFLTTLHLRKVNLPYWMEVVPYTFRGILLAQRIQAEANLLEVEGLDDKARHTVAASIDISLQEIKGLRGDLMAKLNTLRQMALPGTTIH